MKNKPKECFNAGIILGRIHGAKMLNLDDSRTKVLVEEFKKTLPDLGLNLDVHDLVSFEKLASKKIQQVYGKIESACFELGLDLIPLQTNLHMISLASPSKLTNATVCQVATALKALIKQIRIHLVNIGAINIAEPFLFSISRGLADPNEIIKSSATMVSETDLLKSSIEEYLDNQTEMSQVFLVHGHDYGRKEEVARFLEKLNLETIILHEKPNAGRTIIEKFSDYSNVQFAVVLLTADDEGKSLKESGPALPRARQNVILELGYFLGKLGRSNVCVLFESGVEIPSDYSGVLFVEFDQLGKWRMELGRELKAAGIGIDTNKLFK